MQLRNRRGGAFTGLLALLWLVFFFAAMMGYFLWKANYLRFEYGPPVEESTIEKIYDVNSIDQLRKQDEELAKREAVMVKKEKAMAGILRQIDIEKAQLKDDREIVEKKVAEIAQYFEKFTQEEEDNLKRLSKLYETMKAARVVAIFSELDEQTVAQLLVRMKSSASAKILGQMGVENANRAARVSNIIQGKDTSDAFLKTGE